MFEQFFLSRSLNELIGEPAQTGNEPNIFMNINRTRPIRLVRSFAYGYLHRRSVILIEMNKPLFE